MWHFHVFASISVFTVDDFLLCSACWHFVFELETIICSTYIKNPQWIPSADFGIIFFSPSYFVANTIFLEYWSLHAVYRIQSNLNPSILIWFCLNKQHSTCIPIFYSVTDEMPAKTEQRTEHFRGKLEHISCNLFVGTQHPTISSFLKSCRQFCHSLNFRNFTIQKLCEEFV